LGVGMSENMDVVFKESHLVERHDGFILDDIYRREIIEILEKHKYSFEKIKDIFESNVYESLLKMDLNIVFRKIKNEYNISLIDIVTFLFDFAKIKTIIDFFDEESFWILKTEVAKRNNIKLKKTDLISIIG
jgi:hypothetical protein